MTMQIIPLKGAMMGLSIQIRMGYQELSAHNAGMRGLSSGTRTMKIMQQEINKGQL